MAFDFDKLKGATLDDKSFGEVRTHLEEVIAQRDAALAESIAGRKGKDAKIADQAALIVRLSEKLGIDGPDDIDALPDGKGQVEALKQFDAKIKRLVREMGDSDKRYGELEGKYCAERRERAITQAISKHPFIDSDDARALTSARVRAEGDSFVFEVAEGKLVPLDDGVAWMAKTKAHLVRPAGDGGGSGFRGVASGGDGSSKIYSRSEFDTMNPAARMVAVREGATLKD